MYPDIPWLTLVIGVMFLWVATAFFHKLLVRDSILVALLETAALIVAVSLLLGGIAFIHTH